MNYKFVFSTVGKIVLTEGLLLFLPLVVGLCYGEKTAVFAFSVTILIACAAGALAAFLIKPKQKKIYARDGFAIVALSWIFMSLIGALPFVLSGEVKSYVDALFETVSGFTTTGATALRDVEVFSMASHTWRCFTHFLGGMGILVLGMAVIPNFSERSIHIMRAEMPGPVIGKLVPKSRDSAKILYFIYGGVTLSEIICLKISGMPFLESMLTSFSTVGTGGFAVLNSSVAGCTAAQQWIIAVFMIICGINFNLFYLLLIRRFKPALKNSELWVYLSILIVSSVIIGINIYPLCGNSVSETARTAVFQVAAYATTTGTRTANVNVWPPLCRSVLLILMIIGGSAGSTAGGLKVARVMMLFKTSGKEVKRLLHPRSVNVVRMDGEPMDDATLGGTTRYFGLYCIIVILLFIVISFDGFGLETNISAALSCFNNIGPLFDPSGKITCFSDYSVFSKLCLTFAMLLGRLEIFPLIVTLSPSMWRKAR